MLIESTTAEQIAEMKQRLAGRTKDLEAAKTQLSGLSRPVDDDDDDDEEPVGPHPPLQELTLEDIDEDEDDDFVLSPDVPGETPVKVVSAKVPGAEASEEEDTEEDEDEEELDAGGDGDDLKNLFSEDEEEDHPLANLINFLPDVSVQELVDDIEEIKSIIKEWQQQR